MEPIKIIVKDSSAVVFNSVDLASGVRGLMCKFSFNAPWKNLVKNVTFKAGTQTKTILNIKDNEAEIPVNILEEVDSLLEVGIEGFTPAGQLIITTLYAVIGRIRQGAEVDDVEDVPEVWQQVYELAEEAKSLALEAQVDLSDYITKDYANNTYLQSIVAGEGLKVSQNNKIEIDTDVVFVFNAGTSTEVI